MRQSILLSKMNNGHVQRAKPSRPGDAARHGWLVWVAVPLGTTLPIAAYVFWSAMAPDNPVGAPVSIEAEIRQMNFDPLLPPNRLRGPGAIYAVAEGGAYWKVCNVDPELVRGKIQSSPIPNETRNRLEKAGFSVGGNIIQSLNAKLGASHIVSIEYRMSNVSISEIAMSDLFVIQQQLLQDKNCDRMVGKLLDQKKLVCPGYAVLTASTSYKVNFDTSTTSRGDTRLPIQEAVQHQIELETNGEIKLTGANELVGQDLYYGIKLSPVCLTPDNATAPSRLDDAREPPSARIDSKPAPQQGA